MKERPVKQSIEPYLTDLKAGKTTGRAVAEALGVSESWVSKTIKALGVTRAKKPSREQLRRLKEVREQHRLHCAMTMTVAAAAAACKCHPRTIIRLLESQRGK